MNSTDEDLDGAWVLRACPVCGHHPIVYEPPDGMDWPSVFCEHHVVTLFNDGFATSCDDVWECGQLFDDVFGDAIYDDEDNWAVTSMINSAGPGLISTEELDDRDLVGDVSLGGGFSLQSYYAADEDSAGDAVCSMADYVEAVTAKQD